MLPNDAVTGITGLSLVTLVSSSVALLPAASYARAISACAPLPIPAVFHIYS
jgi:hypothetical protein